MTFAEIYGAVLERFDATSAVDIANAKRWVNLFGALLYEVEPWVFRYGTDDVSTSVGVIDVTGEATDMGKVLSVWNAQRVELVELARPDFYRTYQAMVALAQTGKPEAFTLFAGALRVGPPSNEAATYRALYLRRWTDLAADGDDPATVNSFPTSFHWLLVSGAMATGQAHFQDPTGALLEPVVARGMSGLQREFLTETPSVNEQWGSLAWP